MVGKVRTLRFSQFCNFSYTMFAFQPIQVVYRFKIFIEVLMVAMLHRSNKWICIKYLVKAQISVYGNFIFYLIVPNKQTWNSKIDRLFVTSRIKFIIMTLVILSGHWEHYPNRVNHVTFWWILWVLIRPSPPPSQPSCTWVKNFEPLTLSGKKQKLEPYLDLI